MVNAYVQHVLELSSAQPAASAANATNSASAANVAPVNTASGGNAPVTTVNSKCVDLMAVLGSALLLSDELMLERKIEQLFFYISLEPGRPDSFKYSDFLVALASFEKGLSHALGQRAASETFVRTVAQQWVSLADPAHRGTADHDTVISYKDFFDFCTNRQHVVRRLLESLEGLSAQLNSANNSEPDASRNTAEQKHEVPLAPAFEKPADSKSKVASTSENASSAGLVASGPSGGDQWMAVSKFSVFSIDPSVIRTLTNRP